jgi:hypothetical protein
MCFSSLLLRGRIEIDVAEESWKLGVAAKHEHTITESRRPVVASTDAPWIQGLM